MVAWARATVLGAAVSLPQAADTDGLSQFMLEKFDLAIAGCDFAYLAKVDMASDGGASNEPPVWVLWWELIL